MQSADPEIVMAGDLHAAPQPNFQGRWWIRFALLVLHIVIVGAATSLIPGEHAFEFGASTGPVLLIICSIFLWVLLFCAQTRRGILLFCSLLLIQAGCIALVGLNFRAEDRVLRQVVEELDVKKREWASRMEPFRMDALFEITSGKRQLSTRQLQEFQTRAQEGRAKVDELGADIIRLTADAERRIAAVSSRSARNFRLGVESTRPVVEEQQRLMKDYFTENEQLAGFLIDRYGEYAQTSQGLKFKRNEDAQYFDNRLKAIARLQEQFALFKRQWAPQ
jgi:hypothetical protein